MTHYNTFSARQCQAAAKATVEICPLLDLKNLKKIHIRYSTLLLAPLPDTALNAFGVPYGRQPETLPKTKYRTPSEPLRLPVPFSSTINISRDFLYPRIFGLRPATISLLAPLSSPSRAMSLFAKLILIALAAVHVAIAADAKCDAPCVRGDGVWIKCAGTCTATPQRCGSTGQTQAGRVSCGSQTKTCRSSLCPRPNCRRCEGLECGTIQASCGTIKCPSCCGFGRCHGGGGCCSQAWQCPSGQCELN